jgi:enolase-phosphatase E1
LIAVNTPTLAHPVRVILLDIEGTTTPIDFVYHVLFPYARQRVKAFLSAHRTDDDVQADIEQLIEENGRDAAQGLAPPPIQTHDDEVRLASVAAYAEWLMDQDRKSTPLKSLQGRIWEAGYQAGELHSQLFADVPRAFARWRDQQRDICIYSSGSVLAQKLLFSHTEAGDLMRFIRDYFDTRVGAKREAASYRRIAASLDCPASDLLFVSDVVAELDAAHDAGLQTRLCIRPGNPSQPPSSHQAIHSFDEAFL